MKSIVIPALIIYALAVIPVITDVDKQGGIIVFTLFYALFIYGLATLRKTRKPSIRKNMERDFDSTLLFPKFHK